jgi:hypothetical protein
MKKRSKKDSNASSQPGSKPRVQDSTKSQQPLRPQPKVDSPMEKFNTALRKILAAPKKNIKKK